MRTSCLLEFFHNKTFKSRPCFCSSLNVIKLIKATSLDANILFPWNKQWLTSKCYKSHVSHNIVSSLHDFARDPDWVRKKAETSFFISQECLQIRFGWKLCYETWLTGMPPHYTGSKAYTTCLFSDFSLYILPFSFSTIVVELGKKVLDWRKHIRI